MSASGEGCDVDRAVYLAMRELTGEWPGTAAPPHQVPDQGRVRRAFEVLLDHVAWDVLADCGASLAMYTGKVRRRVPAVDRFDRAGVALRRSAEETGIDLAPFTELAWRLVSLKRAAILALWRFLVELEEAGAAGPLAARRLSALVRRESLPALAIAHWEWLFATASAHQAVDVFDWGLQRADARPWALDELDRLAGGDAPDWIVTLALDSPARVSLAAIALADPATIAPRWHQYATRLTSLAAQAARSGPFEQQLTRNAETNLQRVNDLQADEVDVDPVTVEVGSEEEVQGRWRLTVHMERGRVIADSLLGSSPVRLAWHHEQPDEVHRLSAAVPDAVPQATSRPSASVEDEAVAVIGPVDTPHGPVTASSGPVNSAAIELSGPAGRRQVEVAWYGRRSPLSAAVSADGRWAAFAWDSDKHVDHSWIEILDLHEAAEALKSDSSGSPRNRRQLYPLGEPEHDLRSSKLLGSLAFSRSGRWFVATDDDEIHVYRVATWPLQPYEHEALARRRRWAHVTRFPRPDRMRTRERIELRLASASSALWRDDETLIVGTDAGELVNIRCQHPPIIQTLARTSPLIGLRARQGGVEGITASGHLLTIDNAGVVNKIARASVRNATQAVPHPGGWAVLTDDGQLRLIDSKGMAVATAAGVYHALAVDGQGTIAAIDADGGKTLLRHRSDDFLANGPYRQDRRHTVSTVADLVSRDPPNVRLTAVAGLGDGFVVGAEDGCLFKPQSWSGPHRHKVTALHVQPDGDITTSGDAGGTVYAGRPLRLDYDVGSAVHWCATSPGGKVVAAATDSTLSLYVRP